MKYRAGMKILQSEIAHFFPSQLLLLSNFLFEKIHFGTNFFILAILSLFYSKMTEQKHMAHRTLDLFFLELI